MLQHIVECVEQAQCATLALDEGEASEHAYVQSDWEAARVLLLGAGRRAMMG